MPGISGLYINILRIGQFVLKFLWTI